MRDMTALYPPILLLHSLTRWAIVVAGVWLVVAAIRSLGRSVASGASPVGTPWKAYVHSLHVQLVLGVLLMFISPTAQSAWANMGLTMKTRVLRFFTIEHTVMMILAIGLAEAGAARARKAGDAQAAARTTLIFGGLSLLLICAAIPWPFMGDIARPCFRVW